MTAEGVEERRVKHDGRWVTTEVPIGQAFSQNPRRHQRGRGRGQRDAQPKSYDQYDRPLLREFEPLETGSQAKQGTGFTVVSYNVLAQSYTKPGYFPWASSDVLSWDHRWGLLQTELTQLDADIVCLQEVQTSHYESHYLPFATSLEYKALHVARRNKADGCAILYRPSRFVLVQSESVHLDDLTNNKSLHKHTVVLAAVLRCVKTQELLLVVTTHLYYKGNAKQTQVQQLAAITQRIATSNAVTRVVVCGDFNVTPNTFVYDHMVAQGLLSVYTQPRAALASPEDEKQPVVDFGCTTLVQSNKMLDYMFTAGLNACGRLSLPKKGASLLPNHHLGSDHVSLKVWFDGM